MILGLACCCLSGHSLAIPGNMSGSAELRYAQHTAEEGGVTVQDASHFIQQYSVLWSTKGRLREGRAGEYDFSLGYEWSSVDVDIDGATNDIDTPLDKILFRGDVLLAPGGLPIQLHLFSYDMQHLSLGYQQLGELFVNEDSVQQAGIVTSFQNGSHITTGMTLIAGNKNGSYRGEYRDLLTAMPKIFIDFRQTEVRDVEGVSPRDYVDRDLAFVSLNKNKNWFHYRFFTHEDKIDPSQDYQNQTFLLGTIDHVNRRQWVDLTNWIQISTDVSYSETTPSIGSLETQQKRYDYNLFTNAQRTNWRAGFYPSYSRIRDGISLEKQLDVPIIARGQLNRETAWRIRLENQHDQEAFFSSGAFEKESNIYVASRLDMFSQSRYMVSPFLDVEYKDSSEEDGYALRVGAEIYNNQRYRTDSDLFGSYSLSLFDGSVVSGGDTSYWEQQVRGRYAKDLTRDLRSGVEQELTFGSGEYDNDVSDFIQADAAFLTLSDGSSGAIEGTYIRSVTSWFVDHRPASRVYNRLNLSFDYIDSPTDSGGQFSVLHNLNYYGRVLKASLSNELILGGSLHETFRADQDLVSGLSIVRQSGVVANSFESIGRLSYDPDRRHHNEFEIEIEWREFESGGSDQRYKFEQLYEYTLWKDRGLLRRLAVFGEEFEYEDYTPSFGPSSSLLSFTLFTELYPTRQTLFGVRLRYEIDAREQTDTALVFLTAGVDFQKFQVEFDYSYGTRTAGVNKPERVEHTWEMQVRKIF